MPQSISSPLRIRSTIFKSHLGGPQKCAHFYHFRGQSNRVPYTLAEPFSTPLGKPQTWKRNCEMFFENSPGHPGGCPISRPLFARCGKSNKPRSATDTCAPTSRLRVPRHPRRQISFCAIKSKRNLQHILNILRRNLRALLGRSKWRRIQLHIQKPTPPNAVQVSNKPRKIHPATSHGQKIRIFH
jgi:hypothetical protein